MAKITNFFTQTQSIPKVIPRDDQVIKILLETCFFKNKTPNMPPKIRIKPIKTAEMKDVVVDFIMVLCIWDMPSKISTA